MPCRGRHVPPQSGHELLVDRKNVPPSTFFCVAPSNRLRPPYDLSKGLRRTKPSPARPKGVKNMRLCGLKGLRGLAEAGVGGPSQVTNLCCIEKKCHHPLFFGVPLSNRSRPPDDLSKGLHRTRTSSARPKGVKNMRLCGFQGPEGLAEAGVGRPSQVTNLCCIEKKCHHPLFWCTAF